MGMELQLTLQGVGRLPAIALQIDMILLACSSANFEQGKLVILFFIKPLGIAGGCPGAVVVHTHIAMQNNVVDTFDVGVAALMVMA